MTGLPLLSTEGRTTGPERLCGSLSSPVCGVTLVKSVEGAFKLFEMPKVPICRLGSRTAFFLPMA